jgi:hypothetical protein
MKNRPQLAHTYRRLIKKYNFQIILFESHSEPGIFYSYGDGSNILSKDLNLDQPYGQNLFLKLDLYKSIDEYEQYFIGKGYTYSIFENFEEDNNKFNKITRTSNQESLHLTSVKLEEEFKGKKFLKNKDSLSSKGDKHIQDESFFVPLLKGINPLTGEVLSKSDLWQHPKIIADIKEFLKPKTLLSRNSITATIKDTIKKNNDVDIVLIQCGCFFNIIEEDAEYFINEYKFSPTSRPGNLLWTGFPLQSIDYYKNKLREKRVKFCIVEQIKNTSDKQGILRQVTESSDTDAIGTQFLKNKITDKV